MTFFDDEDIELPKGSILDQLSKEELEVHSVEALKERLVVLKAEMKRTETTIEDKGDAKNTAESLFK